MDSPYSDTRTVIAVLRDAARRGDWQTAGELAATTLGQHSLFETKEALAEYLNDLKDALSAARASRAHAVSSLIRLNAAAGFHRAGGDFLRQDISDPADSCQVGEPSAKPSQ